MFLTELTISRLPSKQPVNDRPDIEPEVPEDSVLPDPELPGDEDLPDTEELPGTEDPELEIDDSELPGEDVPEEPQDPNYAGLLRVVPKAHLVYKREQPDGTYTELWNYKVTTVKDTVKLRNTILSGTDIERTQLRSADGVQGYDLWSVGNIEILKITGLPN